MKKGTIFDFYVQGEVLGEGRNFVIYRRCLWEGLDGYPQNIRYRASYEIVEKNLNLEGGEGEIVQWNEPTKEFRPPSHSQVVWVVLGWETLLPDYGVWNLYNGIDIVRVESCLIVSSSWVSIPRRKLPTWWNKY